MGTTQILTSVLILQMRHHLKGKESAFQSSKINCQDRIVRLLRQCYSIDETKKQSTKKHISLLFFSALVIKKKKKKALVRNRYKVFNSIKIEDDMISSLEFILT